MFEKSFVPLSLRQNLAFHLFQDVSDVAQRLLISFRSSSRFFVLSHPHMILLCVPIRYSPFAFFIFYFHCVCLVYRVRVVDKTSGINEIEKLNVISLSLNWIKFSV